MPIISVGANRETPNTLFTRTGHMSTAPVATQRMASHSQAVGIKVLRKAEG